MRGSVLIVVRRFLKMKLSFRGIIMIEMGKIAINVLNIV